MDRKDNRKNLPVESKKRNCILFPAHGVGAVLALVIMAATLPPALSQSNSCDKNWVSTWLASPADQGPQATRIENQTIREIVHTTVGGHLLRLRISNQFGQKHLWIGKVHVAARDHDAAIVPATDHAVTFSGQASISVPPGAIVLSDPVQFGPSSQSDLAVSIYFPKETPETTVHLAALQDSYLSGPGDFVASNMIQDATVIRTWPFLVGIDVAADAGTSIIATFGDSITDGTQSTPGTNRRWPDVLAQRIAAQTSNARLGVVNAGIAGNRLLFNGGASGPAGLGRFDRDVLSQPGVQYVIVLIGINDIGAPGPYTPIDEKITAEDLIVGYKQLIERAHERGIKIFGATLTPIIGSSAYGTPENDKVREAANQWIRTSNEFDGVIDFDQALRDPSNPTQIKSLYGSADHLHPSDAGYQAMGESIQLSSFH